jgi:hypothetical protein
MILIKINAIPEDIKMQNIDDQLYPLFQTDHKQGCMWLKCDKRLTVAKVQSFVNELTDSGYIVDVEHQF